MSSQPLLRSLRRIKVHCNWLIENPLVFSDIQSKPGPGKDLEFELDLDLWWWGWFDYLPDCGVMSAPGPPMSRCHWCPGDEDTGDNRHQLIHLTSKTRHQSTLTGNIARVSLSLLNPPPPPRSVRWSVTWCPLCVPYHWGRARAIYWKLLECNKRNISGPSSLYSKIEINWLFASGVEHILGTTALRVEICKIRKQPSV